MGRELRYNIHGVTCQSEFVIDGEREKEKINERVANSLCE